MRPPVTEQYGQDGPINRREILNYAWLASLGILTVQVAGVSLYLSVPRFKPGQFGGVFEVGPLSALPPVQESPINYAEGRFWLVRDNNKAGTLYKVCPHLDCLLNWDDQTGHFVCPCHGSQFDQDGRYLSGPATRNMDSFLAQVVGPDDNVVSEGQTVPLPANVTETSPVGGQEYTLQVDTGQRILGRSTIE